MKRGNQGEGSCLKGFEAGANEAKATSAAIEHEFTTTPDGFVSLMGRLTAFVIDTTMALVVGSDFFHHLSARR